MVRTRHQSSIAAEEEERAQSLAAVDTNDSDSDEAPEEVSLSTSKKRAISDRKEVARIQKEAKERNKRHRRDEAEDEAEARLPDTADIEAEDPHSLDLLPEDVLQAVTAQEEEEELDIGEDRRIHERRIVSEQLRQGLLQSRKKTFRTQRQAGPVMVQTLGGPTQSRATYARTAESAKDFLHQRLYATATRRPGVVPPRKSAKQFVYFS